MTVLTPHNYTNTVVEITTMSIYLHKPKNFTLAMAQTEAREISKFKFTYLTENEKPAISSFIFLNNLKKEHYF